VPQPKANDAGYSSNPNAEESLATGLSSSVASLQCGGGSWDRKAFHLSQADCSVQVWNVAMENSLVNSGRPGSRSDDALVGSLTASRCRYPIGLLCLESMMAEDLKARFPRQEGRRAWPIALGDFFGQDVLQVFLGFHCKRPYQRPASWTDKHCYAGSVGITAVSSSGFPQNRKEVARLTMR